MDRRTEVTLGLLLGLAVLATGIIIWGAQSGQLQIFGDAVVGPANPAPIPVELSAQPTQTTIVTETFDSLRALDAASTTADWNLDAGEVTLLPGQIDGLAQSLRLAQVTGAKVRVGLTADEDQPAGSTIYHAVSADGGASWQPLAVGGEAVFTQPTGDWRWRALLRRGPASLSPAIQEIQLTFRVKEMEAP